MKRRSFFSILLGFLGVAAIAKAVIPDRKNGLRAVAMKVHPSVYGLEKPNDYETTEEYLDKVVEQLATTGSALAWKITNVMGEVIKVYLLPTHQVVPRAAGLEIGDGWYEYHDIRGESHATWNIPPKSIDRIQSPFPLVR